MRNKKKKKEGTVFGLAIGKQPLRFFCLVSFFLGTVAFYGEATISAVQSAGDERSNSRCATRQGTPVPYLEYLMNNEGVSPSPQQDRNEPQPCPRQESNLHNQ